MDPTRPEPPLRWEQREQPRAPRPGEIVGALHGNQSPATFTLGDAIKTGIAVVGRPSFIAPVLVIGIIVSAVIEAALGPLIPDPPTSIDSLSAALPDLLVALIPTFIFSLVGGILMSLYGQVWAVAATSGPIPGFARVMELASRRWVGVLGVGIVVGLIVTGMWVGLFSVAFLAEDLAAGLSVLLVIVALVLGVWVTARLTMAGWLAADGHSIRASLRGSWRMSEGRVGRIVGWGIAYGLLFGMFAFVLGELLSVVPYVGSGVTEAISLALGYGAGVVLYRRVQADAPAATSRPAPEADLNVG